MLHTVLYGISQTMLRKEELVCERFMAGKFSSALTSLPPNILPSLQPTFARDERVLNGRLKSQECLYKM
jgi:hypothetical protein